MSTDLDTSTPPIARPGGGVVMARGVGVGVGVGGEDGDKEGEDGEQEREPIPMPWRVRFAAGKKIGRIERSVSVVALKSVSLW